MLWDRIATASDLRHIAADAVTSPKTATAMCILGSPSRTTIPRERKTTMALADLSSILKIFGESSTEAGTQEDLYKEVLLMTLARAASSDSNMAPVEIVSIQDIMQRETGEEITESDIRKASRPDLYESANLRKYLRSVEGRLDSSSKTIILQALAEVIKSDTEISGLEVDYFNRVAGALSVTPAELAGLIE